MTLFVACNSISDADYLKFKKANTDLQAKAQLKADSIAILTNDDSSPNINTLRELTIEMLFDIENIRLAIDEIAHEIGDGDPDYGYVEDQIMTYLIGNKDSFMNKGYYLELRLQNYINKVNSLSEYFNFEKIVKSGGVEIESEFSGYIHTDYTDRNSVGLNFDDKPTIACFVILRELDLKVLDIQLKATRQLSKENKEMEALYR
jgi:hypothetical protein